MKYPSSEDEMVDENGQAAFKLSPLYILDGKSNPFKWQEAREQLQE